MKTIIFVFSDGTPARSTVCAETMSLHMATAIATGRTLTVGAAKL